jgi:hypothetical protein
MPDDVTKVVLELQLEVKKLKGQMKEVTGYFEDFQELIQDMTSEFKDTAKEIISGLKDIAKTQRETVDLIKRGERQKQEAFKKTKETIDAQGKAVDDQRKKAAKEGRLGGVKRFAGGMLGGMGLGMLAQRPTAAGVGGMLGRIPSRAAGAVAGFMGTGLSAAYQQYMQYGMAIGGLVGLGDRGQYRGGLRAAGGVGGAGLGYGPTATAQQARAVGRATGNIGAVYRAQQVARATGMGVEEAGGYMGMIRQAGFGFGGRVRGPGGSTTQVGREGTRAMTKMIEAGMVSGIERARLPEFLQGVSSIAQQVGGTVTGRTNVAGISQFMATLGRTGLPGFQGARGAAVAGQLNQAIQRPGGGEAGQAMVLQALGFGKPGGQRTYYEALKLQQKGMQRPETITELFRETYRQLGVEGAGGTPGVQQEANIALSEMTGLSLDQVEQLGEVMNSSKSMDEKMAEVKEIMEEAKPIEEQALEQMTKGFGGVVKHVAGVEAEMVYLGGKVAPAFMSIQKLQLQGLKILVDLLKDIIGVLKEIWFEIKLLVGREYGVFKGDLSATEKLLAERAERTGMMPEATALQRYRKYSRQAKEAKEVKEFQTKAMGTKAAYAPWHIAKGVVGALQAGEGIAGVAAFGKKYGRGWTEEGQQRIRKTMQAAYDESVAKRKLAKEELGATQAAALEAKEKRRRQSDVDEFFRRGRKVGEALGVTEKGREEWHRERRERKGKTPKGSTDPASMRVKYPKKRGEAPSTETR